MDYMNEAKVRVASIRARTWAVTISLIICLLFYLILSIVRKNFDVIEFVLVVAIQLITYSIYFPDGDLFGQKDTTYLANKRAYNIKANFINESKSISKLREFCKYDYEQKKKRYIESECSYIGIDVEEIDILKAKTKKEIKELKTWENNGRLICFDKERKKRLIKLLFKDLPIEENHPETIMSAIENNGYSAIRDESISYKTRSYLRKIFFAVGVGGVLALIGYTLRDGVGWQQIASVCMYLTALLTTAVMSFSNGETCSKVYKNNFYINLSNFISSFFEWANITLPKESE